MSAARLLLSPKLRPWRSGVERLFDGDAASRWLPSALSPSVDRILCRDDRKDLDWARRARAGRDCPITVIGPGPVSGIRPRANEMPLSLWRCEIDDGAEIPADPHRAALQAALADADTERGRSAVESWRRSGLSTRNDVPPDRLERLIDGTVAADTTHVVAVDRELLLNAPDLISRIRADNPSVGLVLAILDETISASMLREWSVKDGVTIVRDPVADTELFKRAGKLYANAHPIGFGAVLAGVPARCAGRPYSAGWGLTDDLDAPGDVERAASLDAFADAALISSAYYRDPYDGRRIAFDEALDIYGFLRDRFSENTKRPYCIGVKWWNHASVKALLDGAGGPAVFTEDFDAAIDGAKAVDGRVIAWSASATEARSNACAKAGIPFLRVEDGFLRSVGLGAALARSASASFDATGIYFDATRPNDLETMLETVDLDDGDIARARQLRDAIVTARLTKYNVGRQTTETVFAEGRTGILVPGQVADDAGILKTLSTTVDCSGKTNVNESLLKTVRARNPGAYIVYKPHPDVEADLRKGRVAEETALAYADAIVRDIDILDLIEACDRIETVSSLAGFEALLRGKDVSVHGMPFYAGWGLTEDLTACSRRTRLRSVDELVFFALIAYGRYIDPDTLLPCRPERLIGNLQRLRGDRVHGIKYAVIKFVSWFGRKIGL